MKPEERAHLELNASRRDLSTSLTRQVEFLVKQLNMSPDEAAAEVRAAPSPALEERESEQIGWYDLGRLMEQAPERGERLWTRIRDDAMLELKTGLRSTRTVESESTGSPLDRARFFAILRAQLVAGAA